MEYADGGNSVTNWMFSVGTVGSAINVALGYIMPLSAIGAYARRVEARNAARFFEATVINKLKGIVIAVAAGSVIFAIQFALDYFDIGARIAQLLDSIDSSRNNGIVWF